MLALMATVGLAFGAKADPLNSTGFESYTGDFAYDLNDSGVALAPRYWVVTNAPPDQSGTVLTAYDESAKPEKVPDAFVDATTTNKYLKVDTNNEVLYRSVEAVDDVNALNPGTEIRDDLYDGLYFDANVQFTASDGDLTYDSENDKLVVWLKATEGETPATNLVVTAATSINAAGEPQNVGNYEVSNITVDADKWYRLTVKALLDDADKPYFNVYIDDVLVEADETSNFYSMVNPNTTEGRRITAVGFQGTGAVDNLVWTREDPFPPEGTYTLALTGADFATSVTVDGNPVSDITSISEDFVVSKTNVAVVVNVGTEDGTFAATTENAGVVISTPARSTEEVQEDEELVTYYLYSFTVTIAAPAADAPYSVALAFVPAGGGEEPTTVEPGGEAQTTTEEAAKAVVVKAPDGSGITDGEAYNTYASYFTQKVTGAGSAWTTTFELNETGTNTLQEAANSALTTAGTGVLAKALTLSSTTAEATAKVTITKGFYWTLATGSALGTWTYPAGTLSTGAEADLTVKKPDLGKGFYKLIVSPQPIEAKAE